MGAKCTANSTVPIVFHAKDGCFVLYMVFLLGMRCSKFGVDWGRDDAASGKVAQGKSTGSTAPSSDVNGEKKNASTTAMSADEKLFNVQTGRLVCYSAWCFVVSLAYSAM